MSLLPERKINVFFSFAYSFEIPQPPLSLHHPVLLSARLTLYSITIPLTTANKWRSRDDASSIYSRPPETPKPTLPLGESLQRLKTRHDHPDINSLDHQIALARGSTMALEMTRAQLQCTTKQEKIRQFNQQEVENEFYRTCHDVFQELSVAVLHIIDA
ncbi:unnamed protein product [Penicillium salamii]|uniref:Uncharacterized protein n=1 Tax=Penicillium salamii TaxID=1612424 RepID=A0A9W4ICT2_9EURO|nr:unnamed protein product [Penicillium salamii]